MSEDSSGKVSNFISEVLQFKSHSGQWIHCWNSPLKCATTTSTVLIVFVTLVPKIVFYQHMSLFVLHV